MELIKAISMHRFVSSPFTSNIFLQTSRNVLVIVIIQESEGEEGEDIEESVEDEEYVDDADDGEQVRFNHLLLLTSISLTPYYG